MRNPACWRGARGRRPWILSFGDDFPDFTPDALPNQDLRELWWRLRTSGVPLPAEHGLIIVDTNNRTHRPYRPGFARKRELRNRGIQLRLIEAWRP